MTYLECRVPGCAAAAIDSDRERLCVAHRQLLWQWDSYVNADAREPFSLDRDRRALDHGAWHPV